MKVPSLFSDGMVLQRDTTVAIWGQALPESIVYLSPSWGNKIKVKSDSNGFWKALSETTNDQKNHSLQCWINLLINLKILLSRLKRIINHMIPTINL